jgi:hypothetical protein
MKRRHYILKQTIFLSIDVLVSVSLPFILLSVLRTRTSPIKTDFGLIQAPF